MIYLQSLSPYVPPTEQKRNICDVARDIQAQWQNVNYAAKPYLQAMLYLRTRADVYKSDSAHTVVLYFLSNATTFRGEHARRLKQELKDLCGIK